MTSSVAISIRQPWAALLVAGVKTIEVRKWPTRRRGPVFIHAAKIMDERPEAWSRITTPELKELAVHRGGIIGVGAISECRQYTNKTAFAHDRELHLNAPDWFLPPRLYGFVFRDMRAVSFYPYTGQTMFFAVKGLAALGVANATV